MKVLGCNALQARLSYVCKQMLNVVYSAAADVRPDVHQSSGCTGFFSSVEFGTYRLHTRIVFFAFKFTALLEWHSFPA